jgi:signal transduction histidine kinase
VTLRLRMAAIVAVAALMGLTLIGLSVLTVGDMRSSAEAAISVDLARVQARADFRDALERVRRALDRVAPGPMAAAAQGELNRLVEELARQVDAQRVFLPEQGQGTPEDMRDLLDRLGDVATAWVELRTQTQREAEVLSEELSHQLPLLRTRVEDLRLSLVGLSRTAAAKAAALESALSALVLMGEIATGNDGVVPPRLADRCQQESEHLRRALDGLATLGLDPAVQSATAQSGEQALAFAGQLRKLMARISDAERGARELRNRRDDLLVQLGAGADAMIIDLPRDVAHRRAEILGRFNNHPYVLGLALVIGLAILAALVIVFASGLEHDVAELMDVARAMERGELAPRLRLDRATRELAEVGRAFSRLAGTLAAVREKQTSYNRVVTGLNRNVFLHEILRVSLTELCRATRSKAGCVYLKVTGRDELLLAETYAVPRGAATPEFVRMGEGLVGEVARSQETLITDDLPRHTMKIVSGTVDAEVGSLALVPMVYKDELMGVLELATLSGFDKDTVHFVEDVVFQIAVAINNARAIETIRTNQMALQNKTIELEELNAALEHANELKSEFLATVSHELRTPLNAIIGFSELVLETDRNISQATRENLQKVLRNGENLLALINDILDLSKIEAHHMTVEAQDFDPRPLVQEVVADFSPVAGRKMVTVRCETQDGPALIQQDPEKLRRIVLNLVSNAIKFTDAGEVGVRLFAIGDRFRIEVRDTGIGIDADNLARIFEKFRQADGSVTRRFGGTGLGLAITKELCHLMGGSVRVLSQPGRGSTFTVTLPNRLPGPGALPDDSASFEQIPSPLP